MADTSIPPMREGDAMQDFDQDLGADQDLSVRLAALEGRAPVSGGPPGLPGRHRRRFALPIALAPALVLVIVATTTAGVVVSRLAQSHPGIENPGQPLAGAQMECMTPPEAAAFLAGHGFTDVDWQVEFGRGHRCGRWQGDVIDDPSIHRTGARLRDPGRSPR